MEPEARDGREPAETVEPAGQANDASRRWETIRQLGGNQPLDAAPRTSTALPIKRPPSIRGPRWRIWATALVLVALAAGLIVALAPWQVNNLARARPVPPIQILISHDLIECPTDIAWSRNQRFIATLGYTGPCPPASSIANSLPLLTQGMYRGPLMRVSQNGEVSQGALAIYNASAGTLITQSKLDDAIYAHVRFPKAYVDWLQNKLGLGPEMLAGINYTHVLWSPDGQRLYVTFDIYVPNAPQAGQLIPGYLMDGLLVTSFQGGAPTIYLHRAASNVGGVTVWDLATGAVRATIPAASPFALSPAGLGYTWSGDTLTVQNPATPDATPPAPPLGPVGAPQAGVSAFTIWQPGVVTDGFFGQAGGLPNLSDVPTFTTDFAALSPDGSLLAGGLGLAAVLVSSKTPTPTMQTLDAYGWGEAPHLPLRDAALSAAAATAGQSGGVPGSLLVGPVAVSWRPDGRELAMQSSVAGANNPSTQVTILDCATGKTRATLTPPLLYGGDFNQAQAPMLRWAPDGRSLLFFDSTTGAITIWSQTSLPN